MKNHPRVHYEQFHRHSLTHPCTNCILPPAWLHAVPSIVSSSHQEDRDGRKDNLQHFRNRECERRHMVGNPRDDGLQNQSSVDVLNPTLSPAMLPLTASGWAPPLPPSQVVVAAVAVVLRIADAQENRIRGAGMVVGAQEPPGPAVTYAMPRCMASSCVLWHCHGVRGFGVWPGLCTTWVDDGGSAKRPARSLGCTLVPAAICLRAAS